MAFHIHKETNETPGIPTVTFGEGEEDERRAEGELHGESEDAPAAFAAEFSSATEVEPGAALRGTDAMEETRQWLGGARLKKLIPVFEEYEMDVDSFKELSAEECQSLINEMPLNTLQKKRLRKTVDELRAKQQMAAKSELKQMATAKASVKTSETGVDFVEDSKEETEDALAEMHSEPRRAAETKKKLTLEQIYTMCCNGESKALADAFATHRIDIDIDAKNERGFTCLYVAAQKGHTPVVSLLIENGANPNIAHTDIGSTPLSVASSKGHIEVVRALLGAKADVNKVRNDGATALFMAAQNGRTEVVRELIRAKADVNKAKKTGSTPLYIASQKNQVEVVRLLLGAKADTSKAMDDGCTSLFIASQNGHIEVIRELLGAKADVNKAKHSGETPLIIAAYYGHTAVVSLLLESGADVDIKNGRGNDALYCARDQKHGEIESLLVAAKNSGPRRAAADGSCCIIL